MHLTGVRRGMTMIGTEMTLGRLSEIIDAYGASPARWPEGERAAAEALLERSEEARRLAGAAADLDLLLDLAPSAEPSADLAARIMAARPRPAPGFAPRMAARPSGWRAFAQLVWPYGSPTVPVGALALSIMLGAGLGAGLPSMANTLALELGSSSAGVNTASASNGAGDQLVAFALAENVYPEEWKQ
mgnify:CR=1 FL=1